MKILASISLVQLIGQLVAARKAIRDHVPYDIPFMRGKPENVARDMWTIGTGLSAPWPVLAAHAAGTVLPLARPRQGLQRAIGWLGSAYILGVLWERITRESFRHPDRETTWQFRESNLRFSIWSISTGSSPTLREDDGVR